MSRSQNDDEPYARSSRRPPPRRPANRNQYQDDDDQDDQDDDEEEDHLASSRQRNRPQSGNRPTNRAGNRNRASASSRQSGSFLDKINQYIDQKQQGAVVEPSHIEPGKRLVALGIDVGAAYAISLVVSFIPMQTFLNNQFVIPLVLCFRDFFYGGRGLGKNLMGLRVVNMATGEGPTLQQVLVRNLIYLGPLLLLQVTERILHLFEIHVSLTTAVVTVKEVLKAVLSFYVLVIVPLEAYRSYAREDSMRLGDALAGTCLVEDEMNFSEILPK
ncbi:MAG: RDD family protein [Candidatus Obscuribacterales bacterium]|nr:RDD family protein [Candidatus Obscuribacterales bacterium]